MIFELSFFVIESLAIYDPCNPTERCGGVYTIKQSLIDWLDENQIDYRWWMDTKMLTKSERMHHVRWLNWNISKYINLEIYDEDAAIQFKLTWL